MRKIRMLVTALVFTLILGLSVVSAECPHQHDKVGYEKPDFGCTYGGTTCCVPLQLGFGQ